MRGLGGGGQPISSEARSRAEVAFGADFSGVRIHQGSAATRAGARAFTQGEDVHFAPGQYDPTSSTGFELLAHELTHVVQQRQGRVTGPQGKDGIVNDATLEAEADRVASRVAAGRAAGLPGSDAGPARASAIQRKPDPDGDGFVNSNNAIDAGVMDRDSNIGALYESFNERNDRLLDYIEVDTHLTIGMGNWADETLPGVMRELLEHSQAGPAIQKHMAAYFKGNNDQWEEIVGDAEMAKTTPITNENVKKALLGTLADKSWADGFIKGRAASYPKAASTGFIEGYTFSIGDDPKGLNHRIVKQTPNGDWAKTAEFSKETFGNGGTVQIHTKKKWKVQHPNRKKPKSESLILTDIASGGDQVWLPSRALRKVGSPKKHLGTDARWMTDPDGFKSALLLVPVAEAQVPIWQSNPVADAENAFGDNVATFGGRATGASIRSAGRPISVALVNAEARFGTVVARGAVGDSASDYRSSADDFVPGYTAWDGNYCVVYLTDPSAEGAPVASASSIKKTVAIGSGSGSVLVGRTATMKKRGKKQKKTPDDKLKDDVFVRVAFQSAGGGRVDTYEGKQMWVPVSVLHEAGDPTSVVEFDWNSVPSHVLPNDPKVSQDPGRKAKFLQDWRALALWRFNDELEYNKLKPKQQKAGRRRGRLIAIWDAWYEPVWGPIPKHKSPVSRHRFPRPAPPKFAHVLDDGHMRVGSFVDELDAPPGVPLPTTTPPIAKELPPPAQVGETSTGDVYAPAPERTREDDMYAPNEEVP